MQADIQGTIDASCPTPTSEQEGQGQIRWGASSVRRKLPGPWFSAHLEVRVGFVSSLYTLLWHIQSHIPSGMKVAFLPFLLR